MFLLFRRRSFFTVLFFCVFVVAAGFFMVLHNQPATSPTLSWVLAEKTFLVDPGHGGTFPGRVNEDNVLEKDINLDIALKLDTFLEETGAKVVMTRRADTDLIPQESQEEKLLLQQRADLDAERAELAAADRELELQYLGKVKDITHLRDNLADKQEQLAQMERDQAAAQQEQARLQRRRQELAADLADWDAGSQRANEQLEQLRQRWQVENEELEAQRQALEQSRLQALEKRQAYQSLDNEVQRLTAEKGSFRQQ